VQVRAALEPRLARGAEGVAELLKLTVGFELNWTKELGDPREKCEIPDIRLWFLRLDAEYPWLPVALDWRAGELARYAAMLVPHQVRAGSFPHSRRLLFVRRMHGEPGRRYSTKAALSFCCRSRPRTGWCSIPRESSCL
jgi:hypothetical protein